jgi:hypothetical protein
VNGNRQFRDDATEDLVLADIIENHQLPLYRDAGLVATHFAHFRNVYLFEAVEELDRRGVVPDPPHIKVVMTGRDHWDIGTASYVYTTLPGLCVPRQCAENIRYNVTQLERFRRCRLAEDMSTTQLSRLREQPELIDDGFGAEWAGMLRTVLVDTRTTTTLPFRTASEIMTAAPATVPFIVPPYLAEHSITEITAPAKLGKSSFILGMVASVVSGTDFLRQPTEQGSVVYLTEERDTTLREGLSRAGLAQSAGLHLLTYWDVPGMPWPAIVAGAEEVAKDVGAKMMVVDTLPQFAGLKADSENDSGSALQAMAPLQGVASRLPLGVMIVRHDRKGGGPVGESGRGSSAYGGAADVIVNLRRPEGNQRPTIRSLHALSRFSETPATQMVERIDSAAPRDGVPAESIFAYVSLGSEGAVVAQEAEQEVLDTLPSDGGAALSLDELVPRCQSKRTTIQTALKALVRSDRICVRGKGTKGNSYRYFLTEMETVGTPVDVPTGASLVGPSSADPLTAAGGIHSAVTPTLIRRKQIAASEAEISAGDPRHNERASVAPGESAGVEAERR